MLVTSPIIEVVGTAKNGKDALELVPKLNPDVICTDLHMPEMNGLEFTREVMMRHPRPILVISASVHEGEDAHHIFQLLEAGAIDMFPKPRGGMASDDGDLARALISKIRILAGVIVFSRTRKMREDRVRTPTPTSTSPPIGIQHVRMVTIGASTGGPQSLHKILAPLPANFPAPIVCVQHISLGFLNGLVSWLADHCALRVKIAEAGERPQPGTVYFPAENKHLELDSNGKFRFGKCAGELLHCPSIDMTFESIAKYYRRSAVGILLTGMGRDGANGLKSLRHAGGTTIAQNEETCVVFGMPKVAIELDACQHVLSLNDIGDMVGKISC